MTMRLDVQWMLIWFVYNVENKSLNFSKLLPTDFAQVIRKYVVQGKSVYAPICYSLNILQQPSMRGNKDHRRNSFDGNSTEIAETGFWRDYGYGMIAYFVSDAKAAGAYGVDENKFSWGLEDIHFTDSLTTLGLEIIRKTHDNYFHVWHPKIAWNKSDDGIL